MSQGITTEGGPVPVERQGVPRAKAGVRSSAGRSRATRIRGPLGDSAASGGAGAPPRRLVRSAPRSLRSVGRCSGGRGLHLDPEDLRQVVLADRTVAGRRAIGKDHLAEIFG